MTDESLEELEEKLKKLEKKKKDIAKLQKISQKEKELQEQIIKLETELKKLDVEFGSEEENYIETQEQQILVNKDFVTHKKQKAEKSIFRSKNFYIYVFCFVLLISGINSIANREYTNEENYNINYNIARSPDLNFYQSRFLYNASYIQNGKCRPRLLVRIPYLENPAFYENGLDWAVDSREYPYITAHVSLVGYDPFITEIRKKQKSNYSIEYISNFKEDSWAYEELITLITPDYTVGQSEESIFNRIVIYGRRNETSAKKRLFGTNFQIPNSLTNIYQLPDACTS